MFDAWIRDHARWRPRSVAAVTPGRSATYGEFDRHVDSVGAHLAAQGLGPRSGVVAIDITDFYLGLVALAALARLGVASSPGDPRAELRLAAEGEPGRDDKRTLRLPAGVLDAAPAPLPDPARDPDAVGRVLMSSGATGPPNRVGLSWRRIDASVQAALRVYGAGRVGTWLCVTGLTTLFGNIVSFTAWHAGAAVGFGFDDLEVPPLLERLPPGLMALGPGHLARVLEALPERFTPQPAWRIVTSGAILPVALGRRACHRISPDLIVNYGATEHTFIATGPFEALEHTHGAVGWPPAGAEVQVVDADGHPVADGEVGEFRVRGARATIGYLDPSPAAERNFRDGWYWPGDIGRRLPDGRLVIEGRADDRMILHGNLKVMPIVFEEAAFAVEGVRDCAAFAVPDADHGLEQAWLAVAAAPGFDRAGLAARLAATPGVPPVSLAWVDAIPRTIRGKVDRSRLRAALLAARGEPRGS